METISHDSTKFSQIARFRLPTWRHRLALVLACVALTLIVANRQALITLAQQCLTPPADLQNWWPLDETSGTTAADIIGTNPGTHLNGPVPAPGKVGGGLSFDGNDDIVQIPDSPELTPNGATGFTVEAWAKSNTTAGNGAVLAKGAPNQDQFLIDHFNGSWRCNMREANNTSRLIVGAPVQAGVFTHLACTWDGANVRFYINGVLQGTLPLTSMKSSNGFMGIGGRDETGYPLNLNFNGIVDEVKIFQRALSASEIQAIVNADSAGLCKPPPPNVCPATPTGASFSNGATFGVVCDNGGRSIQFDNNVTLNSQPAVRITVPPGGTTATISACDSANDASLYTIAPANDAELIVQCGSSNMELLSGNLLMELFNSGNLLASGNALSGTALNFETLNLQQQLNLTSGSLSLQLLNLSGGNLALAELSAGNNLLLNQQLGELSALSSSLGLLQLQLQNLSGGNLALAELSAGNGLLLNQQLGELSALSGNLELLQLQLLNLSGGNLALAELSAGNGLLLNQQLGELSALSSNLELLQLQLLNLSGGNLALAELSAGNGLLLNQQLGELSALSSNLELLQLQLLNLSGGNLALAELSAGNGLLLDQQLGELSALSSNLALLQLQLLNLSGGNLALAELSAGNGLLYDQQLGQLSALSGNLELLQLQLLNQAGSGLALANLEAGNGLLYDQQLSQVQALSSSLQLQFLGTAQEALLNASLEPGSVASFEQAVGALKVLQGAVDAGWLDANGNEIASGLIEAAQEVIFNQLLTQFEVSSLGGLVEMIFKGQGEFSVLAGELDLTLLDLVGEVVGRLSMDAGDTAVWDAVQSLLTVDAGFMNVLLADENSAFAQALLQSGESLNLSSANSPLDILNAMLDLSFMNLTGPSLGPPVAPGSEHVNPPSTSVPLTVIGHLDPRAPGNIHPDGLNPDIFQNHITDVWAYGNFAYLGSFDKPLCSPQTTGVHIIDISDPANPTYAAFVPSPHSTRPNDVKVAHLDTPFFSGELMIRTNEKCSLGFTPDINAGGPIGLPLADPPLGIGLYDVTDPLNPVALVTSFLDFQTHNTYIWQQGENAYLLVANDDGEQGVHIVDITNPAAPVEIAAVSDHDLVDQGLVLQQGLLGHGTSTDPHSDGAHGDLLVHDVWVQTNGSQVVGYISWWDVGMVLLDLTDPTNPIYIGDTDFINPDPLHGGTANGNAHVAVPSEDAKLCITGDEDFFNEAGWGYGRVFDCRNPNNLVELGQMHTGNVTRLPPGNFTSHNVMVADDLAMWSWFHEGMPVFDLSSCRDANGEPSTSCAPVEIGRFVDPNGSDFWGVYLHYMNGTPYLLGSDRDTGLWIIEAPQSDNCPYVYNPDQADANGDGVGDACTPSVTADNANVTVDEGETAVNTGTASDANGDALILTASAGTVVNNNDGTWSWSFTASDGPTQSQTVTITANDGNGGTAVATFDLTVNNVAPTIDSITVPLAPIDINNQPISASASFSDPAASSDAPYTCTVDYDDGSGLQPGTVSGMSCTGPNHTYAEAGVYAVAVTITDKDGGSDSATATNFIVIYDPDGGFVTGGGWINSPAGAYVPDPTLTGKASFGFVSKYKKGASIPTGNTEFNFKAGNFNFHSDNYDWLVVNQGGTNAQFKGSGTVNGSLAPNGAPYKFMLWAKDGSPDTFRIKIWYENGGEVIVYDNGFDQAIGGGSITVHK